MVPKLQNRSLTPQDLLNSIGAQKPKKKKSPSCSITFLYADGNNRALSKNALRLRKETYAFSPLEPPGFLFLCNLGWHAQADASTIRKKANFLTSLWPGVCGTGRHRMFWGFFVSDLAPDVSV